MLSGPGDLLFFNLLIIDINSFLPTGVQKAGQDTLNPAIDQLPKRLTMVVKAKGGHVEFRLDKPYVLDIVRVLQYFE